MDGKLLDMSLEYNSVGIAFTYNEPIIWYEYVLDTARLFKEKGLKTVMVTNGLSGPNHWKNCFHLWMPST